MINLQIAPFFSVPFGYASLENPQTLCTELAELFLAREANGDVYRNQIRRDTQVGLFESKFDLHTWPDAPVQRAFAFIHEAVATMVQQLNQYSPEVYASLVFNYHSWFHVTRTGGHQGVHNHPMASWSGIFCVDAGDSAEDDSSSGCVRFLDPHFGGGMYLDAGNQDFKGQYHQGGQQVRHQMGRLVMFPSYLFHEVFTYRGSRPRIVIAFNSWITIESGQR